MHSSQKVRPKGICSDTLPLEGMELDEDVHFAAQDSAVNRFEKKVDCSRTIATQEIFGIACAGSQETPCFVRSRHMPFWVIRSWCAASVSVSLARGTARAASCLAGAWR